MNLFEVPFDNYSLMSPYYIAPLITVALGGIGFVVWLVRLEAKASANITAIDTVKDVHSEDLKRLGQNLQDLEREFYQHSGNLAFHHNEAAMSEFRNALNDKLVIFATDFRDLHRKLNHLGDRE